MPWYWGNSWPYFHLWFVPLAVWSVFWTGFALWYAARREEKGWFVFFLLVHTAGIVEILYLVFVVNAFSKTKKKSRR